MDIYSCKNLLYVINGVGINSLNDMSTIDAEKIDALSWPIDYVYGPNLQFTINYQIII